MPWHVPTSEYPEIFLVGYLLTVMTLQRNDLLGYNTEPCSYLIRNL
jgi:hypothetical protein